MQTLAGGRTFNSAFKDKDHRCNSHDNEEVYSAVTAGNEEADEVKRRRVRAQYTGKETTPFWLLGKLHY